MAKVLDSASAAAKAIVVNFMPIPPRLVIAHQLGTNGLCSGFSALQVCHHCRRIDIG
jgi:hypothetical protein